MGASPGKLARAINGSSVSTAGSAKAGKRYLHHKCLRSSAAGVAPRGFVPVCVGVDDEAKRFIVHITVLREDEFLELLCMAAEEYGFRYKGALRIPYGAKEFEEWVAGRGMDKTRVRPARRLTRAVRFSGKRVWFPALEVCLRTSD